MTEFAGQLATKSANLVVTARSKDTLADWRKRCGRKLTCTSPLYPLIFRRRGSDNSEPQSIGGPLERLSIGDVDRGHLDVRFKQMSEVPGTLNKSR